MIDKTDQQLLVEFVRQRSDVAFAAVVKRHLDLVHSAALRMVRDPHTAQDVSQSVFLALAGSAGKLLDRPSLAGWLHATTRNKAAKAIRSAVRRRANEQEAALMNQLLSEEPKAAWEQIAPQLDDALGELSEPDREALLLRFFRNHDLRAVGRILGITDDAAQKRVSRALGRLRELFVKRGITVGASGLAILISSHAVQAAPVGLALTISTPSAVAGTTFAATTTTSTSTKIIAMTAIQKSIIATTIVFLSGAGIYQFVSLRKETSLTPVGSLIADAQGGLISRAQYRFAGFGQPEATVMSFHWAISQGDVQTLLASSSPAMQKEMREEWRSLTDDQIKAGLLNDGDNKKVTGYRITNKLVVSDDEVVLDIFQEGRNREKKMRLVHLGDEWRFAGTLTTW